MASTELTVKINFEMTETSKAVLRTEFLKLLSEPEVLNVLLEAFGDRLERDMKLKTGKADT